MAILFLDTSALIKNYIAEIGSNWIHNEIASNQISISELALYETATVLRRRSLEGSFTKRQAAFIYSKIRFEAKTYSVIGLNAARQQQRVASLVFNLPFPLRIRALDSIQLGAALISRDAANSEQPPQAFTFVSADAQLIRVAQHLGLNTENPEDHP